MYLNQPMYCIISCLSLRTRVSVSVRIIEKLNNQGKASQLHIHASTSGMVYSVLSAPTRFFI